MGVLLFYMTTLTMPFVADSIPLLRKAILAGEFEIPSHVSASLRTLLRGLLVVRSLACRPLCSATATHIAVIPSSLPRAHHSQGRPGGEA